MNSQGEEKTPRDMRELEEKRGNVDSGEQEIQSELVDRPPTFADVHAQATELQQESENNGKLPHIPSGKLDGETDPDSEKPRKRVKLGKCGESSLISLAPKQIGIAKWLTVTEVSTVSYAPFTRPYMHLADNIFRTTVAWSVVLPTGPGTSHPLS